MGATQPCRVGSWVHQELPPDRRANAVATQCVIRGMRARMGIVNCRSCGGNALRIILDLGSQPIANALLSEAALDQPEPRFDLAVAFCPACALLQVTETVPAHILYRRDYPYFSSSSPALLKHSAEHVEALARKYELGSRSFVVEVAS